MGRLTLNVLLSFAQFEHEVTGEHSRQNRRLLAQGHWMGGLAPLGYDVCDHRLVLNSAEAANVRDIFNRYLELGCIRRLKETLERSGIQSKVQGPGPQASISGPGCRWCERFRRYWA